MPRHRNRGSTKPRSRAVSAGSSPRAPGRPSNWLGAEPTRRPFLNHSAFEAAEKAPEKAPEAAAAEAVLGVRGRVAGASEPSEAEKAAAEAAAEAAAAAEAEEAADAEEGEEEAEEEVEGGEAGAATRWDVPVTPRREGGSGGRGGGRSLAALRRENAELGAQLEEARAQLRQLARAAPLGGSTGADGGTGTGGDGGGDGDIVLVVRQAREREEARGGGEADARRMQRTAGGGSAAGGGGAAGLSVSALHSRDEAFAQWTREFERGAELQGALQVGCSPAAFAAL